MYEARDQECLNNSLKNLEGLGIGWIFYLNDFFNFPSQCLDVCDCVPREKRVSQGQSISKVKLTSQPIFQLEASSLDV